MGRGEGGRGEAVNKSIVQSVLEWARPVLGLAIIGVFAYALYRAYSDHDTVTISLLVGAIIVKMGTVVDYFFGSSSSSQKKDDVIASVATGNPTPPAVPPGTPPAP